MFSLLQKISKLYGLTQFNIVGPPKAKYLVEIKNYNKIFTVIHILYCLYVTYVSLKINTNLQKSSLLKTLTDLFYTISFLVLIYVNLICTRLFSMKTINLLEKLNDEDKNFKLIGTSLDYKKLKKLSTASILPEYLFVLFYLIFDVYKQYTFFQNLIFALAAAMNFHFNIVVQIINGGQFCITYSIIKNMFEKLNFILKKQTRVTNPNKEIITLRKIILQHSKLCDLSRELNYIFSLKLITGFSFSFVVLLLYMYDFTKMFIDSIPLTQSIILPIIWFSFTVFKLMRYICVS